MQWGDDVSLQPPDLNQLETFWKDIFQKQSEANLQATWVSDLQSQQAAKSFDVREPEIDVDCFTSCLRKLRGSVICSPSKLLSPLM